MAVRMTALVLGLSLLLAGFAPQAGASGLDLNAAKSEGLVGEKADGFVGIVVADPTAPVAALVKQINTKRAAAYAAIAKENGTSVDAVAALAGAKLIERAGKGDWVTDAQGNWRQK
jgi:hypothetical protein